jgi:hypothetical protein
MSKGYSLHIGLNNADPAHYPGMPLLKAAVNDAKFWKSFAGTEGYTSKSLHDNEATADAVKKQLTDYAKIMESGDILMLTYAGHGGDMPNEKPAGLDKENYDQTWCLYDRQMLDDELYECFEAFQEGTRIVIVSDSCHSGTIARVDEINLTDLLAQGMTRSANARGFISRKLPKNVKDMVLYKFGSTVYKPLLAKYKNKRKAEGVKASVKLLAACQDDEETLDGENNGIFTEAFIDILKKPEFNNANAEQLVDEVKHRYFFPQPNFFQYGSIIPSFDNGLPFKIDIPDADKITGYRKPDLSASNGKPARKPAPSNDIITENKPAVLIIEVEGELNTKILGGEEVEITDQKQVAGRQTFTVELKKVPNEHAWSAAHSLQTEIKERGYNVIVEPVLTVNPAQRERVTREGDVNNPDYIHEWPPSLQQGKVGIGWHLDEDHSQLAKANDFIKQKKPDAHVRIGHFDTGYIEGHVALPAKLNTAEAKSFVKKEDPNQAIDKTESGQDGHGLGTLTILAGNKVAPDATFNEFEGYIGGVPFADVIPVRISESVVILNAETFCDALDYAIEKECEVISMSMAGKPSSRMARAVNRAYEAGIIMVTAASNCWYKGPGALLPKCVMFPAAFERVIAATGAMYDHKPYDVDFLQQGRFNITTKYMQGSWGPPSRMRKALAAYTPNIPWASTHHAFLRSGGGTSSATPQVAAAAALWIAYHRDEMEQKGFYTEGNKWKKVEAVRNALYKSAAKDDVFKDWKKYYGNGILRAFDALAIGVPDELELNKAEKAESSFFGITELAGSLFANRRLFRSNLPKPEPEALATELMHLLQTDPQFYDLFSKLDISNPTEVIAVTETEEFKNKVLHSPYASNYLKEAMVE